MLFSEVKPQYILMNAAAALLHCAVLCSAPCFALLTICYKAELSAPVSIFSFLGAGGKRCSGKVCTAERKKEKRRETENEKKRERIQMKKQIKTTDEGEH